MIKITVITCTYNAESVLKRTLDSVLSQSYANVEHLIVDGVSKDSTLRLAENYKRESDAVGNGHEIVIQSEPDKGLYDAMNKSLLMATGDYLVFLNAGDVFPDNETLANVASGVDEKATLPGVIFGDTDIVDEEGRFVRHRRLAPSADTNWRSFKEGMLICHQAFYALTTIARALPYNINYRYSADVDWCIRIMKQSEKEGRSLKYLNRVVVNFLDGGMTTKYHRASLLERFKVMSTHYGLLPTVFQHLWFCIRAIVKK